MILGDYCPPSGSSADLYFTWDDQGTTYTVESEFYPISFTAPTYTTCITGSSISFSINFGGSSSSISYTYNAGTRVLEITVDDDYLVSNHGSTETFYITYSDEYGRTDSEGYIQLHYQSAKKINCESATIDNMSIP